MSERITIRMDSTQVVQWMKCPQLHNFVSVQNLTRVKEDKTAMDRGTIMHGLLERYYTAIHNKEAKASNYAISCLNELKKNVNLSLEDYGFLTIRFLEYVAQYSNDQVEVFTSPEGKPAIEIGFSVTLLDNDDYLFVLEGRIDLLTVMSGQLVVWDHKYQGREYYIYGKSVQALNYRLATGAKMFMYNYVRGHKKVQPNTFVRKHDSISKLQLERWKSKLIGVFMARADQTTFDEYPNQSCTDIGFGKKCPFTDVCEEQAPGVRALILARDFYQRKEWEPWSLEDNGEFE